MANRLTRVLEIASYLVTVAPAAGAILAFFGGLAAGVVTYYKQLGALATILVTVFVFSSILQAIEASVLLYDRATQRRWERQTENANIHYHVAPSTAFIVYDESNPEAEFQIRVPLVNDSQFPVRYLVTLARATIDDRVTPDAQPNYVPGILPTGKSTLIQFNSYARGRLSREGLLRGKVELTYRYGHASKDFVFESKRLYRLKCDLSPNAKRPPGSPSQMFPIGLSVVSEDDQLIG